MMRRRSGERDAAACEPPDGGSPRRRWALAGAGLLLAGAVGGAAVAGVGWSQRGGPAAASAAAQPASDPGTPAPDGTFTTTAGTIATIASLRGRPLLVWFVAGGCASCAASIPAVASHLGQLTSTGLDVLTLGLYGAFAGGRHGLTQLLSFGRAAAGTNVVEPDWQWGMASKSLSLAYDPTGLPDLYVLVGPGGHIRYRNSVPVSTMAQLLTAAHQLHARSPAPVGRRR